KVEDVRVCAKTTMADGDAPLVAQGSGHEPVMQTLDDEARQRESPARSARLRLLAAENAHTRDSAQALQQSPAERDLLLEHRVEAELEHRFDGDAERDRADDVG